MSTWLAQSPIFEPWVCLPVNFCYNKADWKNVNFENS